VDANEDRRGARSMDMVELERERAELLPDRRTMAIIKINRNEFDEETVTIASPGSRSEHIGAASDPKAENVVGQVVSEIRSQRNIIVQP
jgi:hypothetical protein